MFDLELSSPILRRIPSAINSETAVRCWLVSSFKLNIGFIQTPKCPRVGKLAAEQLLVVLDILHVESIVNVAVHADYQERAERDLHKGIL